MNENYEEYIEPEEMEWHFDYLNEKGEWNSKIFLSTKLSDAKRQAEDFAKEHSIKEMIYMGAETIC